MLANRGRSTAKKVKEENHEMREEKRNGEEKGKGEKERKTEIIRRDDGEGGDERDKGKQNRSTIDNGQTARTIGCISLRRDF